MEEQDINSPSKVGVTHSEEPSSPQKDSEEYQSNIAVEENNVNISMEEESYTTVPSPKEQTPSIDQSSSNWISPTANPFPVTSTPTQSCKTVMYDRKQGYGESESTGSMAQTEATCSSDQYRMPPPISGTSFQDEEREQRFHDTETQTEEDYSERMSTLQDSLFSKLQSMETHMSSMDWKLQDIYTRLQIPHAAVESNESTERVSFKDNDEESSV